MLKKLDNSFWFWITLAFVNLFTLSFFIQAEDRLSISMAACLLFFCLAKSIKGASRLDNER